MLQGTLEGLLRLWEWEPASGWRRHFVFLGPAALLLAAVAYIGAVRTHTCGHDVILTLDDAWRVLCGQRPHVDYFSALGPVYQLLSAAGLALAGLRSEGVGYAAVLGGTVTGLWGYRLALSRMRFLPSVLTGLFLVLLASAPVPLGAGPFSLSHAMAYNRLGFALLALVVLEVMEAPSQARRKEWSEFLSGASTGMVCVLLLFLKGSFFLVAAGLVASFAIFRPRSGRSWLGFVSGVLLALAPMLAYLRWNAGAFLADQILVAGARSQLLSLRHVLELAWRNQGNLFLMVLVAAMVTLWRKAGSRGGGIGEWNWVAAAVAVYGAGILLMSTNGQDEGLPLSVVLVMLMTGLPGSPASEGEAARRILRIGLAASALAALLLWAAAVSLDSVSLLEAVREKFQPPPRAGTFLPEHMSGLLLYDFEDPGHPLANSNGSRYTEAVNEGIRLLQARSDPRESVATLEQLNPFSYALLRKPALGGASFLSYGFSFDARHKPAAERLFGQTDIVMVPKKHFTDPGQYETILGTYLPYVKETFTLAAESPTWWMYRRKR